LASAVAQLHTLENVFDFPNQTNAAAFSPDGKTLLLGGQNASLIDMVRRQQRCAIKISDRHGVNCAAFHPDGNLFAISTIGGLVRFAETSTGQTRGPDITHNGTSRWLAFSPDGKTLLVAARDGVALQCYDVESHQPKGPLFASPESLATLCTSTVGLMSSTCGQAPLLAASSVFPGRPYRANLYFAAYSADGERVLTAAQENNASLWEAKTGKRIGGPLPHPGVVYAAGFSPDSKILITGCQDGKVRFWDAHKSRQPLGPATINHNAPVNSTVFSRDGSRALTSAQDGTARLWNAATGRPAGQLLSHPAQLLLALFVPPDQAHILTTGYEGTARLWRIAREETLAKILRPDAGPVVAFSHDGKRVLTGCAESQERRGESRLWDADTGSPLTPAMPQHGQLMAAAFSPDGRWVVTGGNDGNARLWKTADSSPAHQPWPYGAPVAATAFSPDNRLVAFGGRGGIVHLYDVVTGKGMATWPVYDPKDREWVWSLAFSPDGQTLLIGGGKASHLRRVVDGASIGQPMRHNAEARTTLLSEDGQVVLTCCKDGTARLWSARSGEPLSPVLAHKGEVLGGAFRPDGKVVATASADRTVRLWEVPSGRPFVTSPLLHSGWVQSVAFSRDGKTLATG
jgi:WD40 repeat protein